MSYSPPERTFSEEFIDERTATIISSFVAKEYSFAVSPRKAHFAPLSYQPEVDGLRCIAVLPVVFFHFKLGFPGGFAGVDVFFVISGYLISSIILSGEASLQQFWARRVRRLYPALWAMLATVLIVGRIVLVPLQLQKYLAIAKDELAVLLMGANIYFYTKIDYFFQKLEAPLLHCWSLAVEEQFYLVYPCCVWLLLHCGAGRTFIFGCLVFFLGCSLAACIFWTPIDHTFAFYMLPMRAWQMILGGLVAIGREYSAKAHLNTPSQDWCSWLTEVAGWAGLLSIITSYFIFSERTPWPSYAAVLPSAGAGLFIWSQHAGPTSSARIIGSALPVFIGRMSYSLYLWHWPIYIFLIGESIGGTLDWQSTAIGLLASMSVAALSYLLVEPVFRSQTKVSDVTFFFGVVVTWLTLFGFCYAVMQGSLEALSPAVHTTNLTCYRPPALKTNACVPWLNESQIDKVYAVKTSRVTATMISQEGLGGCWDAYVKFSFTETNGGPYVVSHNKSWVGAGNISTPAKAAQQNISIVVLGTSHCMHFGPLIEELAWDYKVGVAFLCIAGPFGKWNLDVDYDGPPSDGQLPHPPVKNVDWDKLRLEYLDAIKPRLIVWLDMWANFWEYDQHKPSWFPAPEIYDFKSTFDVLMPKAREFVIFGDTPALNLHGDKGIIPELLAMAKASNNSFDFLRHWQVDAFYEKRRLMVEKNLTCILTDPKMKYSTRGRFVPLAQYVLVGKTNVPSLIDPCTGGLLYCDRDHLSVRTYSRFRQIFQKEIFGQARCHEASEKLKIELGTEKNDAPLCEELYAHSRFPLRQT